MKITGLETLVFGVDDVAGAARYLTDYGLTPVNATEAGGRFEALDGTAVVIAHRDDPQLPRPPARGCRLRKTVMGVADPSVLDAIDAELRRDREVRRLSNGAIESVDDSGFTIGFQVSTRRAFTLAGEISNAPGGVFFRPVNHLGALGPDAVIQPRSLSHIVYFVPDALKAEAFYVNRLGFRCTDRFAGVGPFLQPAGSLDHHTHFLIGAPPFMHGVEHFTFHFGGPTEMITNGYRFIEKGYQAFWGPGRHILGSNWFWYFNSPFACHMEMDADMDLHDATWTPRVVNLKADNSQTFLLKFRKKWMPGPEAHANGDYA
jgi:catechol 2,3-dioxygenase-like lactoylglutathione lyase family enzyme